ncbi:hypothetical protein LRK24_10260 [Rhodanobacter denitrificans]|uniref:hypothetical protein n=1 Tax=Rhodanobacter denitrificans TaxID=666685 RepID=UPI000260FEDD|nr:hypothetical protein [Rhodanobacter denitrificans]EIM04123.1 hypothetical protein UUC_02845 [Rhodanobacter denitrificans]UJM88845.1 hypothetical protein LRK24_10260 [Rhodanobacter denitrificans]
MNAPDQLPTDGGSVLSAEDARTVADFINLCIRDGLPPDVGLALLSRHDLDAPQGMPEHRPGVRCFYLVLRPTPTRLHEFSVVLGADEPGSDCLRIPVGEALSAVGRIEQAAGDVDALAHDLTSRHTLLSVPDRHEASQVLASAERETNSACDDLRAAAGDPKSWEPIGPRASLYGTLAAFRAGDDSE